MSDINKLLNMEQIDYYRDRLHDKDTILKYLARQKLIKYKFKNKNIAKEKFLENIQNNLNQLQKIADTPENADELKKLASEIIIYAYAYASNTNAKYIDETIFNLIDKMEET